MAHSGVGYNFVDSPSGLIVPVGSDTTIGGEPVIYTFNEPKLPRWYD